MSSVNKTATRQLPIRVANPTVRSLIKTRKIGVPYKTNRPQNRLKNGGTLSASQWSRHFSAAIIDVTAGRRDIMSVRRWMSTNLFRVFSYKIENSDIPKQSSMPAVTFSSRSWEVDKGVCEVSCAVWDRGQMRAVAVRVENFRGRWIAVELEYG